MISGVGGDLVRPLYVVAFLVRTKDILSFVHVLSLII